MRNLARTLALAQSALYMGTGLWALVSIETFEKVTGPKVDRWLVKGFGALSSAVGGAIFAGGVAGRPRAGTFVLAIASATAIAVSEGYYSLKGRISKIYFLDAVLQLLLAAGWLFLAKRNLAGAKIVVSSRDQ